MTIIPLSEGVFTVGHDKEFVPFNEDQDVLTDRPRGSLLVEIQPFLIKTDRHLILLDAGLGFADNTGALQIHKNIEAAGYQVSDVDMVLLSHLHKDHTGGLIQYKEGKAVAAFPEAVYYVYAAEMEEALQGGSGSYDQEFLQDFTEVCEVNKLEAAEGLIATGIRYEHSGGHCKNHIVWILEEDGASAFFGGDEAPQLKQMKVKYVAKYDYDGKKAMELRKAYEERGRTEGWQFLFYHDVKMPVARL